MEEPWPDDKAGMPMRVWFVLLVAVTLITGVLGCQGPDKWHEPKDGELRDAVPAALWHPPEPVVVQPTDR